jgi:hypothetical protein
MRIPGRIRNTFFAWFRAEIFQGHACKFVDCCESREVLGMGSCRFEDESEFLFEGPGAEEEYHAANC